MGGRSYGSADEACGGEAPIPDGGRPAGRRFQADVLAVGRTSTCLAYVRKVVVRPKSDRIRLSCHTHLLVHVAQCISVTVVMMWR